MSKTSSSLLWSWGGHALQQKSSPFAFVDHEVFAITAHHEGRRSGFIATWVLPASIQEGYPQCLILSSPGNYTHELILASKRLVLHLLGRDQAELLPLLGLDSGRDHPDKLAKVEGQIVGDHADFILSNTCGYAVCQLQQRFALDEREALVGQVLHQEIVPGASALTKRQAFADLDDESRMRLQEKQKEVAARAARSH
jgi:flavin reductase (DIM6/NTAB) family NADH-FMN oxidoreductase RutF